MKTEYCCLALLMLLSLTNINSQSLKIEYEQGFGRYSMDELKILNKSIQNELPFETKLVADFPMYWYYRPGIGLSFDKFDFTLFLLYCSTGSRISGQDYTANFRFDSNVNSYSPGIKVKYNFEKKKNMYFSIYCILEVDFAALELTEYLSISESTVTNSTMKFKGRNFAFEPGASINYSIKFIDISLNLGYSLNASEKAFYLKDKKDNILRNAETSNPIDPDWQGLRIGLSTSLTINKRKG